MEAMQNNNPAIRPVLTRAGLFKGPGGFIIPSHQHFDYELIYSINGKYECEHNGNRFMLNAGEGLLNCPGDWHTDILQNEVSYYAINFVFQPGQEPGQSLFPHSATDKNQLIFHDRDSSIRPLCDKLLSENKKIDQFSSSIQEALLMEMFWQIVRLLPKDMVAFEFFEDAEKAKFQKKMELLCQQYIHESLSLKQMAASMKITPRTLTNHCHQLLGISPVKAFTKAKMEHAMQLVSKTDMSIKEISEYLGFANPYHFSKVFKRSYHTPPKSLRDKK